MLAEPCRNGMPRLVESRQAFGPLAHLAALLFRTHLNLQDRLIHIIHGNKTMLPADSKQGCLIHEVFKIGTGESGRSLGNGIQINIIAELFVA